MTFASVCSGVGGFDEGFIRAGFECRLICEIDKQAASVLQRHYPDTPFVSDIHNVHIEPRSIDVLIGGIPCQDYSVAGNRAGLAGDKGAIFWEFLRIVDEARPQWCVIENVPGILSSDGGDSLRTILDAMEALGYILSMDIINAQHFGVAQRRKRVFLVWEHVDFILPATTTTSELTMAQCLTEILLGILEGNCTQYENEHARSRLLPNLKDGVQRRMKLFDLSPENCHWQKWLDDLGVANPKYAGMPDGSELSPCVSEESLTETVTLSEPIDEATQEKLSASWNTEPEWKSIFADICEEAKEFITSTESRPITESRIYSFANLSLSIAERICRLNGSSPTCWSAGLSCLTLIEQCMNYARQSSRDLFSDMEWVQPWIDFDDRATQACVALRNLRVRSWGQVLPLAESLQRHPAPVRKAGEITATGAGTGRPAGQGNELDFLIPQLAGTLGGGSGARGYNNSLDVCGAFIPQLSKTLLGKPNDSQDPTMQTYIPQVTHTLRREGFDASEDGTGRGTPIIATARNSGQGFWTDDGLATLRAQLGGMPENLVAFAQNQRDEVWIMDKAGALAAKPGMKQQTYIAFSSKDSGLDAGNLSPTLRAMGHDKSHANAGGQVAIAFGWNKSGSQTMRVDDSATDALQASESSNPAVMVQWASGGGQTENPTAQALRANAEHNYQFLHEQSSVRRLTPRECERLMSWPDDFTRWGMNGEEMADGPRYQMCGNGVVTNVAEWIAKRILEAGK